MLRISGFLLLIAVGIAACDMNSLAPEEALPSQAIAHGLVTQLVIDRAAVAPGAAFNATYSITNTRAEPVRLESSCMALARGVVYQNGQETEFIGSGSGCYTAIGSHEIAAGKTLERTWQVEAAIVRWAYSDGRRDISLAVPGEYVFRVIPNVLQLNGAEARLSALEQRVMVR